MRQESMLSAQTMVLTTALQNVQSSTVHELRILFSYVFEQVAFRFGHYVERLCRRRAVVQDWTTPPIAASCDVIRTSRANRSR